MQVKDYSLLTKIFLPFAIEEMDDFRKKELKLVHYTSAEAAINILKSRSFWLRHYSTMNDVREIVHGKELLEYSLKNETGQSLMRALKGVDSTIVSSDLVLEKLEDSLRNCYFGSLSAFDPTESRMGRLSMWRGYGGAESVALVLNPNAVLSDIDNLHIYSSPVAYGAKEKVDEILKNILKGVTGNQDFLKSLKAGEVQNTFLRALLFGAACLKHLGFSEEREWRVAYFPDLFPSKHVLSSLVTIKGAPQIVHKAPLGSASDGASDHLKISTLIEQVIIGPTRYPKVIEEAFLSVLKELGVTDAQSRIIVSDIPLRV